MRNLEGKNVAVLGLGVEGKDLVKYLLGKKAKVTVFDKKKEKELDLTGFEKEAISLKAGEDYSLEGLGEFEIVFRSPGVYRYLPEIIDAEKKGTEITSAVKLFFELCPAKIIGVTGTKGKGTTATLIYRILKASGLNTFLAGNIGRPYLELLSNLNEDDLVVLELSSFQLIDLKKSPHLSVVLNITEDHLDWHKDKQEYVSSKENIVKYQGKDDYSVINADYETPKKFSELTKAQVFYFSKKGKVKGSYVKDEKIVLSTDSKEEIMGSTEDLLLKGKHNWENVTAAVCTASLAEASLEAIKNEIFSFKGLEHRLELVGEVKGVTFYNDSFATSPQPTIAAINSFDDPTTIILGGSEKGLDYQDLGKVVAESKNVKNVILIGSVVDKIKESLNKSGFDGEIFDLDSKSMREIVKKAHEVTPKGGVVLLSPAAASFDMFKDYKDRGSQFKKEVGNLGNN